MIQGIEQIDGIPWIVFHDILPIKKVMEHIPSSTYDKVEDLLKVPFSFNNTRVLHWIGVDISGHEYLKYNYKPPLVEGKYQVMPHQIDSAGKMVTWGKCFNLSEPRSGKSVSVICGVDFLKQQGKVTSTLVIAPLSTLYSVWDKEIMGMLPRSTVGVLHNETKTKKAKADYFQELIDQDMDYYLINPAGLRNPDTLKVLIEARMEGHFNAIVVDESTEFSNQSTKNWKGLNKVKAKSEYLWLLTGTPGGAEKVHGQARLVNPDSVPSDKSLWKMQTMTEVKKHIWIHKPEAVAMIREVLNPSVRYKRKDVLKDMPPERVTYLNVPLNKTQKSLFDLLKRDMLVKLMSKGEKEIKAANAAVLSSKLLQICSGSVIPTDKDVQRLDISLRIDECERLITEAEGKAIVVGNFKDNIAYIAQELTKRGFKVTTVTGDTSAKKRAYIFTSFMNDPDEFGVIVVHPTVVKFGVELASASDIIFWSPPMIANLAYSQVKDRIHSGKQKALAPTCYLMYSTPLEKGMFQSLEDGVNWETNVSDFFNTEIKELINYE